MSQSGAEARHAAKALRNEREIGKKNGYGPKRVTICFYCIFFGVADGARTHDNRNHNPD